MSGTLFFGAAVAAGLLLLGAVVYSYLQPQPGQRTSVTSLLGILGFALVASPNWTSISIKSEGLELSLIRELQARQLAILSEIRSDDAAAAPAASDARPDPPGAHSAPPAPRLESAPAPPAASDPVGRPRAVARSAASGVSPQRVEHLFDAFERGELALAQLSDGELLALSQQITSRLHER